VVVGFSGSRRLSADWAPLVGALVGSLPASAGVLVGDAAGADALVRQAAPAARVFVAASFVPAALVARSVALVQALERQPAPRWLVVLPGCPCPSGILPAAVWRSGSPASGSWSAAALAAGLGIPVLVVGAPSLPAWRGGAWSPVSSPPWSPSPALPAGAAAWSPAVALAAPAGPQLALF
jgi:hypothetical protein